MIVDDFQSAAAAQGSQYENIVAGTLENRGWVIRNRGWVEESTLVQVDLVVRDENEKIWWVECKGSYRGQRPGCMRTDTMKKAICSAALLSSVENGADFMLATSNLPRPGSAGARWLDLACDHGWITKVEIIPFSFQVRP